MQSAVETNLLTLLGLGAQSIFAALLAVLLRRFHRRHRRPYLLEWSYAWWAFCAAQAGGMYGVANLGILAADHWSRLAATALSQTGALWHGAWMLLGTYAISTGRTFDRRGRLALLAGLALLGSLSAFAYAFDPGAARERLFVRVGVRALILSVALVAAGAAMWRFYRRSTATGPRFVSFAFFACGLHQGLLFGIAGGWLGLGYGLGLGYLDLLLIGLLGLSTVVWLLEEEHFRLTDASRQIEQLAFFDMVTGLPNRKLFLDRLRQEMELSAQEGKGAALLFLDLDHFKRINDSYGHDVGDLALAAVAERLRHSVREGDVVGRLGGDEFTVLLPGVASPAEAAAAAGQLLERLREPLSAGGHRMVLAASVGSSLFPADGDDPGTLLRKADIAMYRAKEAGRNRHVGFDDAMSESSRERYALELALRSENLASQLVLHYQPIVKSGSGEIVGAEALVRWLHPERGLLPPVEFLPVAEASGAAEVISDWVLESACRQCAEWRQRFHDGLTVSVNLTARAFESPRLLETVDRALTRSGLPAHALELEITETMALLSGGEPLATLGRLRQRGARVAVDDFGIGYSSLSYLRELPIGTVKLDSSFIRELGRRPEDSRIVGAVIQLAHGLGMDVVAEGVEEEEQMAVLEMLYCDKMQGFLFSRPLPPADFEALMDAARPFRAARAPSPDPGG